MVRSYHAKQTIQMVYDVMAPPRGSCGRMSAHMRHVVHTLRAFSYWFHNWLQSILQDTDMCSRWCHQCRHLHYDRVCLRTRWCLKKEKKNSSDLNCRMGQVILRLYWSNFHFIFENLDSSRIVLINIQYFHFWKKSEMLGTCSVKDNHSNLIYCCIVI